MKLIITGAAAGIGLVVAKAFAEKGAAVALCDVDKTALAKLSDSFYACYADVADQKQMAVFMNKAISKLGGVDVLINNAGTGGPQGAVETLSPDEWKKCLAISVHGMFHAVQAAVPVMKSQRAGCIINMSSNAGTHGLPDRTPYVAAKWAVNGMTKSLAMELGDFGIRVNAICPGSVEGERIDRVINNDAADRGLSPETVKERYQRQSSLRCFVKAEDIAAMALYLASPAGMRISGQCIGIDGHTETLGRI